MLSPKPLIAFASLGMLLFAGITRTNAATPQPKPNWEVGPFQMKSAPDDLAFYYSDDAPAFNELFVRARGTQLYLTLNGVVVRDWDGDVCLEGRD